MIKAWDKPCWNRPAASRRRRRAAVGRKERDTDSVDRVRVAMTIASHHTKPTNVTPFSEPL
jgi:hypothetical protein